MSSISTDLETIIEVTGYQFKAATLLEGVDNVAIAHGIRNRDNLRVIAKLSHQPLRLEREYHIVQRLYRKPGTKDALCKPLDKIQLSNRLIAFLYEDYNDNILDTYQIPTPDIQQQQQQDYLLVQQSQQQLLSLHTFLDFAIQCCNCLEMIHKHQIVHGEIKLNAFLWPRNNSVKIWNFGSGSKSLEMSLTSEGWRKKTTINRNNNNSGANNFLQMLIYMSPEQTGRTCFQPDHRTDLYSLGIAFFIALTQSLPFAHNSPMEIIHNVLNKKLPFVHNVRPETPIVISMIIEKLTNKSPDERYTSAHGLRQDLKECLNQLNATGKIERFTLGKYDIASIFALPNNGCFGRTQELNLVNSIIKRTAYMYNANMRRCKNSGTSTTDPTPLTVASKRHDDITAAIIKTNDMVNNPTPYHPNMTIPNNSKKRPTEIIAISGNTGVGKSTFVRNIQQFSREYGYIALARLDPRQPTPYGCLLRCLSIFLKNILTEPTSKIDRFSRMLKEQLGIETIAQLPTLLVDNVPELASFLNQPSLQRTRSTSSNNSNCSNNSSTGINGTAVGSEYDMEGEEIKLRFHSAFIGIFQVMVNFKFVTLFLEDLHQSDEASIELLHSLISAKLNFLIILTYRDDNEISQLITKIISNEDSVVTNVKIENLDRTALMDLVRTTMHRLEQVDIVLLAPLIDFIQTRTHGNPFYACQLLMTLEKKNLIYFTWEKTRWEFNPHEIDKAMFSEIKEDANGNMDIDFLVRRLKELPRDGQKFLKWASFIGNSFSFETVRDVIAVAENSANDNHKDCNDNNDSEDDGSTSEEEIKEDEVAEEGTPNTSSMNDKRTRRSNSCGSNSSTANNTTTHSNGKKHRKYDAINGLQSALQQGFIQPFNNDEFKFTHDRYSQAAMMLTTPESKDTFHLKIASHFMHKENVDKFWVADHVKAAIHLIKASQGVKSSYRRVLIQAGDKAFDSGAHKLAFSYYSVAKQLLTLVNPWIDDEDSKYTETLHLYTRLAEISWFMDYGLTRKYLNTILTHATSAIDRAAAYRVQHRYRWSRNRDSRESAAPILLQCLRELGVEDIEIGLDNKGLEDLYSMTRREILKTGIDTILKLPVCDSRLIRTRLSIMEELCLWAFWTNDMKAMLSVGSRFILKTIRYGTTPSTGVGLVFFGIAAVQLFKAYQLGEHIGRVGVSLCKSYGGNSESSRARYLYAAFLSSWKNPYKEAIPKCHLAMKQALLAGDRIYSAFAHLHVATGKLFICENMSENLRDAKSCLEETDCLGQTVGTSIAAQTLIQVILACQGKTKLTEDAIFDDDEFVEQAFLKKAIREHPYSETQFYFYQSMKAITLSFYGFHEASVKQSSQYLYMAESLPSLRHTHSMFFFRCISYIRLIGNKSLGPEHLTEVERCRARLEEWAQNAHPLNIQMYVTCIDAEMASLQGDPLKAQRLFDLAIRQAAEGNWPSEHAFFCEFAGEYYARLELPTVAYRLIKSAIAGFRHVGIYGRVNQLEERHKALLLQHETSYCLFNKTKKNISVQTDATVIAVANSHSKRESMCDMNSLTDPYPSVEILEESNDTSNTINSSNDTNVISNKMQTSPEETLLTLDVVDLASILKSSQVISSEMNFDLLMKQMLGIILENSGAESGVIIVKENASFLIVASGSQTDGCEILNPPKPLVLYEEGPNSSAAVVSRVSQYAIHSQESLFIADIQQDSRFSDSDSATATGSNTSISQQIDTSAITTTPNSTSKSCICTPIIHKTTIVGCIYIEGAIGSLTSRHEVVLRLLSQQIGISLTNALLFKSIHKVTYANVKMIENQKAALEEARKSKEAALHAMKLKAAFLANMSHELRTPFSGFYGMISLLSETTLDAEQQDIVHTAKESCEMLLRIIDDLLNFSKLEASKVTLDLGPLCPEEIIADTIEILSSLAARKGLELAYIVDHDVPSTIIGDSSRLRQILTNLLGNAIKFTHEGGVVIKCQLDTEGTTAQQYENSEELIKLKFEVVDTGIGIHPEQQCQLFEPFSQVDGSTTRMYGGTGLGLSICLQLVRLMMGDIGVQSETNKGSNFWFTAIVNKQPMQIKEFDADEKSAALRFTLHDQNILVATHSDLNAKMLRSLLSCFNIKHTTNMYQAIPQALQGHHPVLILDIPPNPSSYIVHQLQSVDDDPECELHIILLYTPSTEGHKLAAEATNSVSERKGRLVKMAKPVRRIKLLRILEQVLEPTPSQLSHTSLPLSRLPPISQGSRIKDYFEKEELSWYAQKPVLIAEDNMVAQKLLRKQLERMGFYVESANNGQEAVALWQKRPASYFCIGFFDHHMPKCDGVEATRRIRKLELGTGLRLPIVALTADIQTSARDVCLEAGMDGYLTKPLIPKDLAVTLRSLNLAMQKHYDTPISSTPSSPLSSASSSSHS